MVLKRALTGVALGGYIVLAATNPVASQSQTQPAEAVRHEVATHADAYLESQKSGPGLVPPPEPDGPDSISPAGWYGRAPPEVGPAATLTTPDPGGPSLYEASTDVIESFSSAQSSAEAMREQLEEPAKTKSEYSDGPPPPTDEAAVASEEPEPEPESNAADSQWKPDQKPSAGPAPDAPTAEQPGFEESPAAADSEGPEPADEVLPDADDANVIPEGAQSEAEPAHETEAEETVADPDQATELSDGWQRDGTDPNPEPEQDDADAEMGPSWW